MIKLQNNFTTPEQSKRLMELGVPADSADCYIQISECVKYNFDEKREEIYKKCEYGVIGGSGIFGSEIPALLHLSDGSPEYLPCWSVGRLIEMYLKTRTGLITRNFTFHISDADDIIEILVSRFQLGIIDHKLDFSKLED